ncbi:hypothetical protein [Streptosporangium sp. NBC_01756]|uniref:hypothetical protein n=1 Tax=Streptosporangium sp. NBC_01756 TaxID=2975950 RepID=UPI002DDA63A4|nr:hypothetical protein [Streptosporangium sp. NBC_01756]WSC90027.1 hypothetical protein OIE48_18145 [Streptosporangium sp. NBC_01756]
MRATPPLLLPLLRSNTVGELSAWLYLHPEMGILDDRPRRPDGRVPFDGES